MATTPHAPEPPKHDDKPKHDDDKAPPKAKEASAPEQKHATLPPEEAVSLFKNGHRIAKDGDPQEKWISMSRATDGTAVQQRPMTDDIIESIKSGSYYLVDDQGV